MGKTKFLLAGGLDSIHIYNLVKNVLIHTDYEITAYNTTGNLDSIPRNYLNLYQKAGIIIIPGRNVAKVGISQYIRGVFSDLRKLGKFDILNLHYVSHYVAPVIALLSRNYGKIILSFWGSDLLRSTGIKRMVTMPAIRKASTLQLMTAGMLERFSQIKGYRKHIGKVKVLDFGDMFLDGIDIIHAQAEQSRDAIKKSFGLLPDRPTVVIGYVGRPEMQQLKAVKSILADPDINKNSFQIALPVYGMHQEARDELDNIMKISGIHYRIFPDFMKEDEVVKFRSVTDIFIHPQTSDALSCSVVECFYAGSIVINGGWLNYDTLDKDGVYYHKFKDFNELSSSLNNILSNYHRELSACKKNKQILRTKIHWDSLRPHWIEMYER